MSDVQEWAKNAKDNLTEIKHDNEIKKKAEYNLAYPTKSWPEKHPFIMLLIGVILGFLSNYILEYLKIYHMIGL